MVVPDSAMIAEIILFAEGFSNTKVTYPCYLEILVIIILIMLLIMILIIMILTLGCRDAFYRKSAAVPSLTQHNTLPLQSMDVNFVSVVVGFTVFRVFDVYGFYYYYHYHYYHYH